MVGLWGQVSVMCFASSLEVSIYRVGSWSTHIDLTPRPTLNARQSWKPRCRHRPRLSTSPRKHGASLDKELSTATGMVNRWLDARMLLPQNSCRWYCRNWINPPALLITDCLTVYWYLSRQLGSIDNPSWWSIHELVSRVGDLVTSSHRLHACDHFALWNGHLCSSYLGGSLTCPA